MVHAKEESEREQIDAGDRAPPFGAHDTFSIMFDAGLPSMPLLGCSGVLAKCGVGEGDEGLLALVPEEETGDLDDWIFMEVQGMEESGEARSSRDLTTLKMVLPGFLGLQFEVKSAWLELPPGSMEVEQEESIPMVLKVHGLTVAEPETFRSRLQHHRVTLRMPKRRASCGRGGEESRRLGSVPEGDEAAGPEAGEGSHDDEQVPQQ